MLEMPKLIRAWKSVRTISTSFTLLIQMVIIANSWNTHRSGRETGPSSRNKQRDAENLLLYPGDHVHTPCISMYNNEKRIFRFSLLSFPCYLS